MFSKLSDKAIAPSRGSTGAAGYDLYAAYDATIPAQGKALVKTDIAVAIPQGWYGRVAPRLVRKFIFKLCFIKVLWSVKCKRAHPLQFLINFKIHC